MPPPPSAPNPYINFPSDEPLPQRPDTMPNGVKSWLQDRLSKPLVTGDRSLSANPNGRGGAPQLDAMGDRIGSRGMTPLRRMEMLSRRAYTQGDNKALTQTTGALLNVAQNQQGMNFQREQDANKFQQNVQLWQANSQEAAADLSLRQSHAEKMAKEAQTNREAEIKDRQQWDLSMYGLAQGAAAMEAERKRRQEEEDRKRVPNITVTPTPGSPYNTVTADGKVINVLPQTRPPEVPSIQMTPVAPGGNQYVPMTPDGNVVPGQPTYTGETVPGSYVRRGTQGMPQAPKQYTPNAPPPRPQAFKKEDGTTEYREYDAKTGGWRKVKFIDEDGDGLPDPPQPTGAGTPGAAWQGLGGR